MPSSMSASVDSTRPSVVRATRVPGRSRSGVIGKSAWATTPSGGQFGPAAGRQLALEHADQFMLGVEGVGAHQGLSGEARGGGEQGAFVGAEVVRGVPADEAGAGHAARGGQRKDREAAGSDVGE